MEKKKVYAVATSHLDTVWRWNLATTIKEYLPDTLEKNFDLADKISPLQIQFRRRVQISACRGILPQAL